ncbi:methylated-DNA--[protein]-cysteine S-methyltransferase [Jannaschia aquimarina]|uniref:Methylated-DNA--protein-cysteine methyltransferase n=1 Tax=Jannaschia aquimarina TaxID=935700 RepID=A0A0D1EA54_9RHOB|nr:methylated-DNA--[protein]-cysteine S-methyltransferase [Jannaschia aquimarina]KIT14564.1 Methylated-DNA--protein-cysteine methyltransferase [Jannaschia aquimarina]SNT35144.1 methylated-DNA-[protein]-cysteine S-methyltransferase [Jannaschia aquimarina]
MITFAPIETVIGPVLIAGRDGEITHLRLPGDDGPPRADADWLEAPAIWKDAEDRVHAILAGSDRDVPPLAPEGSQFQLRIWKALRAIPRGETRSYAQIARAVGRPGGTQAVGQANGRNPIPLLIPCHRVIAADGSLGGFSGSLTIKRRLLEMEGAWQPRLI